MYTEEFEGLEEAEKGPRAYVSSVSQQDAEKLHRENEKLKKALEKEKFFNKLLDQELKDVKAESATRQPADSRPRNRSISSGAFYTLLVLSLAMAGFIFYTLYYNKQYSLFENNGGNIASSSKQVEQPEQTLITEPQQKVSSENIIPANPPATPPPVKDSVPNIIGKTETKAPVVEQPKKKAVAPAPEVVKDDDNEKVVAEAATLSPVAAQVVRQPAREPIAKYRVTSKANFYNAPDENTLGRTFISGGNKIVDAYEDQNGFIYVEYVNERGMVNKGWLSKKDLTKE
jgi:hypothetical protein